MTDPFGCPSPSPPLLSFPLKMVLPGLDTTGRVTDGSVHSFACAWSLLRADQSHPSGVEMTAPPPSPLLALLKSRRREAEAPTLKPRNPNERIAPPPGPANKPVVMARPREGASEQTKEQKDPALTTPSRKSTAASSTVATASSMHTPPEFTPRRRRLRKLGKDALMNFQRKREETLRRHANRDFEDDDVSDDEVPAPQESAPRSPEGLDDLLEGFDDLALAGGRPVQRAASPRDDDGDVAPVATGVAPPRLPRRAHPRDQDAEPAAPHTHAVPAAAGHPRSPPGRALWRPSSASSDGGEGTHIALPDGFELSLPFPLYPHQHEGIRWLWGLHRMRRGGILADDMGLGKTMQCAAFLSGLFANALVKRALIVAPKTLLKQWKNELTKCGLGGW